MITIIKKLLAKTKNRCIIKRTHKMETDLVKMSIKEKFEKNIYKLENCPRILYMKNAGGIFFNKNTPNPDEKEALEKLVWKVDEISSQKLKAASYGDWEFEVRMINSDYFESREKLDHMYIEESERTISDCCINVDRIPIEKAMKILGVEVSCNMEYYLHHRSEIEKDVNRRFDSDLELKQGNLKILEQEIFYKQMCKLFGSEDCNDKNEANDESSLYEKSFILYDFRWLSYDGNDKFATARRGNYYLLFFSTY